MDLGELRALVEEWEDLPDETEIRFAHQPNYPLECSISSQTVVDEQESGETVIYLAEGHSIGYAPGNVTDPLGWG